MCISRACLSVALVPSVVAVVAPSAGAHPLGNNSITQFNIIYPFKDRVEVEYFIVFAELPTNDILSEIDTDRDGAESPAESEVWVRKMLERLTGESLQIRVNDRPIPLVLKKQKQDDGKPVDWYSLSKQPSEIRGLWHLYFMARFQAEIGEEHLEEINTIEYHDLSFDDTFGVKRVLADLTDEQKQQVTIVEKSVNSIDEEENPFDYQYYNPLDPVVERDAMIRFKIIGWEPKPDPASQPAVASAESVPLSGIHDPEAQRRLQAPETKNTLADYFSENRLTFWTLLVGSILALISGATHALAPGHAKTAVAAYLISQHGSYRHAITLAGTVTFTHVFFVILLGVVILSVGARAGQSLQLWLGLVSGVMIAGMGGWLLYRAVAGRIGHHHHHHDHGHEHGHGHHHHHHDDDLPHTLSGWLRRLFSHSHPHLDVAHEHGHEQPHHHPHEHEHDHSHDHDPGHHHHEHAHGDTVPAAAPVSQITARQIILLGIAGGMVPCPTATIIMLAMIGINRVGLGLYIIGVFSLGLALMLMAVGVFALTSQRFAARILRDETTGELNPRSNLILTRLLPACSGTVVALFGTVIAAHYVYMMTTNRPLIPWLA